MSGALVFRGTRMPVATLFENLKDGATIDDFLEWYPGTTREQVEAVINHEIREMQARSCERRWGFEDSLRPRHTRAPAQAVGRT